MNIRHAHRFVRNPYLQSLAVLAVASAVLLWMYPLLELRGPMMMLLLTTVALAAWWGGWGPGVMTLVLSLGVAAFFFLEPLYDPRLGVRTDWIRLGMFVVLGGIIIAIGERRLRNARELERVTDEARRQKRLYETTLASTPDLVYVFDLNHRFTYANAALLDMWGRSWEEAAGRTLREVGYERWHAEMHERELDQVVETGRPVRGEVPFRHSRLGRRIYDYIMAPIIGPDGQVEGVAGTTRDVTEQREAEEALRESERRVRALFDQAAVGIVQATREGRLVMVNDRFCELMGYTRDELLAMEEPIEGLTVPEDLPVVQEAIERLSGGEADHAEVEKRHIRRDGSVVWDIMSVSALRDDEGRLEALMAVFQDISERKRTEQRLEQLNRTLEERVAERTAEVEKRAEQLRFMAKELTEAEQRERRRLARLLHDDLQQILVAARMQLELGSGDRPSPVDAAEDLVGRAIDTARSLSTELAPPVLYDLGFVPALEWLGRWAGQRYGLSVEVEAEQDVEIADEQLRVLVFQAVRELLLNVVKHAGVDEALVALRRDGERLLVEVEDRGVGFDPEEVSQEMGADGYGLLSLRERLELMGSRLELTSAPGQGAHARLTLPSTPSVSTPGEEEGEEEAPGNGGSQPGEDGEVNAAIRVILTDDHEVVRRGLVDLIDAQPDMEVVAEAGSGEEAVELVLQHRPDVTVMDISLPGISGIEATRRIMRKVTKTRVIGLSIHEERDVTEALRSAGAQAYFNKGQGTEELVRAIRQLARSGDGQSDGEPSSEKP